MGAARRTPFDRALLAAALVLALLLGRELASLRASAAAAGGGGASSSGTAPLPAPAERLDRVRALVDGNDAGAREATALLTAEFPRDAAGWELKARFHQGAGERPEAVLAWARAVREEPELADEGGARFRGDLIEALAEEEFARLRAARSRGALAPGEKQELEAVYYLRRRLAGGCE